MTSSGRGPGEGPGPGAGLRVDLVSIFPAYFDVLDLSLAGKARAQGLLDVHVHDLRSFTHDRHRTVDDSPYGGGAGMVMKPEPWGEAIDAILAGTTDSSGRAVLVVPTPSGVPFTQAAAADLATADRLVVACGRYEGIDQRVVDHYADQLEVREISLGDYVLNGGEVAALAVVEAVARLLPGFMGNAGSLAEESHGEAGLLEYPVFTKPASWRGHDVPPVLLSGDHARIAGWRHAQAVRRTAQRRPDLLHPSRPPRSPTSTTSPCPRRTAPWPTGDSARRRGGDPHHAARLLARRGPCQRRPGAPAPEESVDDVVAGLATYTTWVLRSHGRLIGSVRAHSEPTGPGSWAASWWRRTCAAAVSGAGCSSASRRSHRTAPGYALITGAGSEANLRRYRRAGYRPDRERLSGDPRAVRLVKPSGDAADRARRGAAPISSAACRCGRIDPWSTTSTVTSAPDAERRRRTCHRGSRARGLIGTDRDLTDPRPWATCGADEETP